MTDANNTDPSLNGRVAIVTGGGRGLGYEMAMALVGAGAKIVITSARETTELENVAAEAKDIAGDGELIALQADVLRVRRLRNGGPRDHRPLRRAALSDKQRWARTEVDQPRLRPEANAVL